jgi:hypothetical protein
MQPISTEELTTNLPATRCGSLSELRPDWSPGQFAEVKPATAVLTGLQVAGEIVSLLLLLVNFLAFNYRSIYSLFFSVMSSSLANVPRNLSFQDHSYLQLRCRI